LCIFFFFYCSLSNPAVGSSSPLLFFHLFTFPSYTSLFCHLRCNFLTSNYCISIISLPPSSLSFLVIRFRFLTTRNSLSYQFPSEAFAAKHVPFPLPSFACAAPYYDRTSHRFSLSPSPIPSPFRSASFYVLNLSRTLPHNRHP